MGSMVQCNIRKLVRVCFWSNTGGAQLVETNVKCFWSTTSATATTSAITNTSMYV